MYAVKPSAHLNEQVRTRLAKIDATSPRLFASAFESLPPEAYRRQYDLLLFSECFQYIQRADFFANSARLVKPTAVVVICNFFKTAAHFDGGAGDRSFSGGHLLDEFYHRINDSPFEIESDADLTKRVIPNIALLDEWLTVRLVPAAGSIDSYLQGAYPKMTRWRNGCCVKNWRAPVTSISPGTAARRCSRNIKATG